MVQNNFFYIKRTGNRRGRPIARERTRTRWVWFPSVLADPGGGLDRPCYKDKNRKCYDSYRQHQPTFKSGLVHFVPFVKVHYSYTPEESIKRATK